MELINSTQDNLGFIDIFQDPQTMYSLRRKLIEIGSIMKKNLLLKHHLH